MGAPDVVKIFYHHHDFSDRRDARNGILSMYPESAKNFNTYLQVELALDPSLPEELPEPVMPKPRSFSGTQSITYHDTKLLK